MFRLKGVNACCVQEGDAPGHAASLGPAAAKSLGKHCVGDTETQAQAFQLESVAEDATCLSRELEPRIPAVPVPEPATVPAAEPAADPSAAAEAPAAATPDPKSLSPHSEAVASLSNSLNVVLYFSLKSHIDDN